MHGFCGRWPWAAPRVERWLVWQQAHVLMNQSLLFVGATMAFVGAILVLLAADQLAYLIADLTMVGPVFFAAFGEANSGRPSWALLLAARYRCGGLRPKSPP